VLAHATVIDGTGAPARADMTIVIEDSQIQSIQPSAVQAPPKGARVVDLHGRYVMPGLIDAHVHMSDVEPDMAHYQVYLRALLDGGVTSVRDMAGNARQLGYLAQQTNSDALAGPDIFYSALMAGPSFFANDARVASAAPGLAVGTAPWMHAVDAQTDLPLLMAQAKGTGATGIKIYANLPAPLVTAIAREAHRQGLQVWTHASIFPARPSDAVAAGADTISHSAYLVWEASASMPADYGVRAKGDFAHVRPDAPGIIALLDNMKARGTILDATLDLFRDKAERHPDEVGAGIVPWIYRVTQLAHERGVPIAAGTDSTGLPADADGNPDLHALPGVHAEMAVLVEHAGFTPIEAIRAATQGSARALGQQATRGTLVAGKRADLIVLTADPGTDIHNSTKIDFVIKDGKEFRRGD
jgi:imidazolonepropionase-like amidohydrolase